MNSGIVKDQVRTQDDWPDVGDALGWRGRELGELPSIFEARSGHMVETRCK